MNTPTGGAGYGMPDAFQRHGAYFGPLRRSFQHQRGKPPLAALPEDHVDLGASVSRASNLVRSPAAPPLPALPRIPQEHGRPGSRGALPTAAAEPATQQAAILTAKVREAVSAVAMERSMPQNMEGMAMTAMWLPPESGLHSGGPYREAWVDRNGLNVGALGLDAGGVTIGGAYFGDDYVNYAAVRSATWGGLDWRLAGGVFGGRDYVGFGLGLRTCPVDGQATTSAKLVVALGGDCALSDGGPAEPADRAILAAAFDKDPSDIHPEQYRWLEISRMRELSLAPRAGAWLAVGAQARVARVRSTDEVLRFPLPIWEARELLYPERKDGQPVDDRGLAPAIKRWVTTKLEAWDVKQGRVDIPALEQVRDKLAVGQQLTVSRRGSLRLGIALGCLPATSLLNEVLNVGFVGAGVRLNGELYLSVRRVDADHVDVVWIPGHAKAEDVSLSVPLCAQVSLRGISAESLVQSFRLDLSTAAGREWYGKICAGQLPDDIDKAVRDVQQSDEPEVAATRILKAANDHLPQGVQRRFLRLAQPTVTSRGGGYFNWVFLNGINAFRMRHSIDNVTTNGAVGVATHEKRAGTLWGTLRCGTQERGVYAQTRRLAAVDEAAELRARGVDGVILGAYFVDVAAGSRRHGHRELFEALHAWGVYLKDEDATPDGRNEEVLVRREVSPADMRALARYGETLRSGAEEPTTQQSLEQLCQWLVSHASDKPDNGGEHQAPCTPVSRSAERLATRLRRLLVGLCDAGLAARQPSAAAYGRGAEALLELVDGEGLVAMAAVHWLLGGRQEDVVVELRSRALLAPADNAQRIRLKYAERLKVPQDPSDQTVDAIVSRFADVDDALARLASARDDLASTPLVEEQDRVRKDAVLGRCEHELRAVVTPVCEADRQALLAALRARLTRARRNRQQLQRICDFLDTRHDVVQRVVADAEELMGRHPGGLAGLLGGASSERVVACMCRLHGELAAALDRVEEQQTSVRANPLYDSAARAGLLADLDAVAKRLRHQADLGAQDAGGALLVSNDKLGLLIGAVDIWTPLFVAALAEGKRRADDQARR